MRDTTMMLRTVIAFAAATHAYVVCLPYVSCFEVRNRTLVLQLEAYWCPPGGGDFDWEEGRAQDAHGCVFRGLELVARIGAFAGDVRKAVEAGVLALGLPEPEIIQDTILQARNATCQAILSLTLAARQDLGATFARGCDGETVALMADREDWEAEWTKDGEEKAWETSASVERRAPSEAASDIVAALGEAPPKFWLADVSWRSPHVAKRWRGCSSRWSHAMYEALATHPARVLKIDEADIVFLDVEMAQERNWPAMHAGPRASNMLRWRGCLPGADGDTYGWFPDKWPPRDHGYAWLLEKLDERGLQSHAKLVVFDMRGDPRPSAVERVVIAGAALADGYRGVALPTPRFPGQRYAPAAACAGTGVVAFRGRDTHIVRPFLSAHKTTRQTVVTVCRDQYDVSEFQPKTCDNADDGVACCVPPDGFDAYSALLRNATFGLVPRGHSRFSYRFLEILDHGAVPVIISDGWRLPFDDIIDWAGAAFRAFEGDAPHIVEALRSAVPGTLACDMAKRGAEIAPLLGSFETVLELLLRSLNRHLAYRIYEKGGHVLVDATPRLI